MTKPNSALQNQDQVHLSVPSGPPMQAQLPHGAWVALADSDWVNIVNAPEVLREQDAGNPDIAINAAVRLTEARLKELNCAALQAGGDETPVAWITEDGSKFIWDSTLARKGRELYPEYTVPLFTRPTPAAAAGVPTDAHRLSILASFIHEVLMGVYEDDDAKAIHDAKRALERTGLLSLTDVVLLSAGAPAVPLVDEQDSSSSHLAAPSSTVPSAVPASPSDGSGQRAHVADTSSWRPIETAPFEQVEFAPGRTDPWLMWCLLGRRDKHGWIEWVGGMDAGMWLARESDRACGECEAPTHWMPLPPPPVLCDGRDGVTGSGATSEAAEGTSSSSGSDGAPGHMCGMQGYNPMLGDSCPACDHNAALRAVPHQPTGERE